MSTLENEVFISYAWGGESEQITNKIDIALQQRGIKLIRDKRNLGFKGSIKEFMERIGRGNCVIVVISDKYLRSENCMFELIEIAENQNFHDRIFPIVLQDANIYKAVNRIKYVKHWEDQISELDLAMKTVNAANLQGITDEINLYTRIRATIAELVNILKDMNTLTPEMHESSNFSHLIEAIDERIKTSLETSNPKMITNTNVFSNLPSEAETTFHQDLNSLIQHTTNDFEEIKGEEDFVHPETGSIAYKSKFSFEYSTSNDIWYQTGDRTYHFSCRFYDGTDLQEADAIFTEYARLIKLVLAKEWKFQEQDNSDRLDRKTLEGIRRYNTMRLELKLTAYKSTKNCQVTFKIEKEK